MRVRERPDEIAAAVAELLARPDERRRLERAAGAFASRLPGWDDAAAALEDAWRAAAFAPAARTA